MFKYLCKSLNCRQFVPKPFRFIIAYLYKKKNRTLTIWYNDHFEFMEYLFHFVQHWIFICKSFSTLLKIYTNAILYFIENLYVYHFVSTKYLYVCYFVRLGIFLCLPFPTYVKIYVGHFEPIIALLKFNFLMLRSNLFLYYIFLKSKLKKKSFTSYSNFFLYIYNILTNRTVNIRLKHLLNLT